MKKEVTICGYFLEAKTGSASKMFVGKPRLANISKRVVFDRKNNTIYSATKVPTSDVQAVLADTMELGFKYG